MSKRIYVPIALLFCVTLACSGGQRAAGPAAPPTRTPLPTFTVTPIPVSPPTPTPAPVLIDTPTPILATATPTTTFTAIPTDTPVPTPMPTETPLPPTNTPPPTPTEAPPTEPPTPEPIIKYVIADTQRELNCDFTYIHGTVKNANNFGIPDVEVRALGIHQTTGLEFTTRTDAEGRYEIFRIPFADLLSGQWAVMLMEDGREVSERFHWGSTPACEGDDPGNSQVLRLDWKLIE